MQNRKQLSPEEFSEPELSYFGLQAYVGDTKHAGGLKTTRALIELCQINNAKYVLDVGCGVGRTPCYLAKRHGCRVVGVDISETMIDWSKERAKREGVENRVEFRVADAQNLPFEDALFDAVIGESITTLLEDKHRGVSEYVRVTKPGGYVGLNEMTWIKTPPPAELVEYLFRTTGAKMETSDGWKGLLEGSGLRDVVARTYKINVPRELIYRIRQLGLKEFSSILYRVLCLYIRSSAYRRYIRERPSAPKNIYEYWGYRIYVGRK